jgi:hypothetical protein
MEEQLMLMIAKFVTDNYEGLYEIYSTQINQDEMTFDEFCVKMYINNLKNNIDEIKDL